MPRRIEIELTSRTDDGAYTWRAAGAKQPRGTVAAGLLADNVSVGDVVRAEVESGIEGVEVVAVLRSEKSEERPANRIEVLGAPRRGPDVLVSYASGRRRRDEGDRGGRGEQAEGRRARETGARRPAGRGPQTSPSEGRSARGRRERSGAQGSGTGTGAPREGRAFDRSPQVAREGTESGAQGDGDAPRSRRSGSPTDRRGVPAARRAAPRPAVSTAYRNALLATLGPQELPVAEQLLRGGIPAVRQALVDQARRPGTPATAANREAVLAIAEQLLPRVNLANWKDRATSAQAAGRELRLRELRAVVTSARTVTLDEEAKALSRALQESLDQRVRALREEWVARMTKALEVGRVADAVRVSAHPPEPATRLPADLAVRLAEAAGSAMTAESDPVEWTTLLDAVVESPVRRTVKPRGIPDVEEIKAAARRAAGLVPELAKLLGLRIPPPPPRRPPGSSPRVMAAGGAGPAGGR